MPVIEYYNTYRTVSTASVAQVHGPIYQGSIEQWKQYEQHLKPLIVSLGEPS